MNTAASPCDAATNTILNRIHVACTQVGDGTNVRLTAAEVSSTGITMYIAHRREGSPWQDEVGSPEGFYALYELRKAGSFDLEQPCIFPADGRRAYGTLEGVPVEILARGDSDDTPQDVLITTRTTWTPSSTAY